MLRLSERHTYQKVIFIQETTSINASASNITTAKTPPLNIYYGCVAKYILYNLIKKGLITFSTLHSFSFPWENRGVKGFGFNDAFCLTGS